MAEDGDYPFIVNVRNAFRETKINIRVAYHYCPYNQLIGDNGSTDTSYHDIKPGEVLCFPLYWYDYDFLEISLDRENLPPDSRYNIWCGPKALVRIQEKTYGEQTAKQTRHDIAPAITPLSGQKTVREKTTLTGAERLETFYRGGAWVFEKHPDSGWILEIHKRFHDPEEENVAVGEDPPGINA